MEQKYLVSNLLGCLILSQLQIGNFFDSEKSKSDAQGMQKQINIMRTIENFLPP